MHYYATDELSQLFSTLQSQFSDLRIIWIFQILILLIPKWFILKKAGEKGWKCLIPFYGKYTFFRTFWSAKPYWGLLAIALKTYVCGTLASAIVLLDISFIMLQNAVLTAYFLFIALNLSFSIVACNVAGVVIAVKLLHKMSRYFGHGAPFTAGLVFFPVIFYFILAFSKPKQL